MITVISCCFWDLCLKNDFWREQLMNSCSKEVKRSQKKRNEWGYYVSPEFWIVQVLFIFHFLCFQKLQPDWMKYSANWPLCMVIWLFTPALARNWNLTFAQLSVWLMMIKEIKLQKLAKMYTCWLDSCLVTRKHRNHTQSTTCSNRRGWLKGHFETSIL